jgi:WD40 repeat protein
VAEAVTGHVFLDLDRAGTVTAASFSPDGMYIATANSYDRFTRVWKASSGMEMARSAGWTSYISWGVLGKYVLSGVDNFSARVWESHTGKEIARIVEDSMITSAAFSPDERTVVSATENGRIQIWKIPGEDLHPRLYESHGSIRFSQNGAAAAIERIDIGIEVLDLESGSPLAYFANYQFLWGAPLSPDQQSLLARRRWGSVSVLGIYTNKEIELENSREGPGVAVFSPDNKSVAGAGAQQICTWDAETGRQVSCFALNGLVYSVAYSPDGRYLATGGADGIARVVEASSGKEIVRYSENLPVSSVAFSPDGKYVISTAEIQGHIWEAASGIAIFELAAPGLNAILGFSPDGAYMLTKGYAEVSVWQLSTGNEVARIPQAEPVHAAFSRDGKRILVAGSNGVIMKHFWRAEDLVRDACSRLDRNLTRFEWQRYIGGVLPYQAICPQYPLEGEPLPIPTPSPIPTNTPAPVLPMLP